MEQVSRKPVKHIFVCTNERSEGDCCSNVCGFDIFRELKDFVKSNGFAGSVWVTRTGCQGFCNDVGATISIYPDQILYSKVTKDDVQKIKEFIVAVGKA